MLQKARVRKYCCFTEMCGIIPFHIFGLSILKGQIKGVRLSLFTRFAVIVVVVVQTMSVAILL